MNYRDKDICDRLYVATPYGLSDYYLLIDARKEIVRLRELLQKYENRSEKEKMEHVNTQIHP